MWMPFDLPILAGVAFSGWLAGRSAAAKQVRGRNDILSVVAHDLRSPLSVISSSSGLLLEGPELGPAQRTRTRTLQMTQRAVGQMDRLISDLLDATRLETGQLRLDRAPVDARTLMPQIEETFRQAALDRQVGLQCVVPVSNALKFTPRHGLIAVSVFDRFFQARKGDLRGVGLGLPITQGIVEAYGGRIWLESAVGVGSTFYFSIPAVPYATLMVGRPGMLPRLTASFRTNVSGTRKELNTCSTQSITSGAASSVLRLLGSPRRASA